MKKILFTSLLICVAFTIFAGCTKKITLPPKDLPFDTTGSEIVKNLDSYDLMNEVIERWYNEKNYSSIANFNFSTSGADQNYKEVIKVNDSKFFWENRTITTGIKKLNYAEKIYNDGVVQKNILIKDNKNLVTYNKELTEILADYSGLTYQPYNDLERETKLKQFFNDYDLSTRNSLATSHDKSVYLKNDYYYFTITVKTVGAENEAHNNNIIKIIENETGANNITFTSDSTIQFQCIKDKDGFKIVSLYKFEEYEGKLLITLKVKQILSLVFNYEETAYTITEEDIKEV